MNINSVRPDIQTNRPEPVLPEVNEQGGVGRLFTDGERLVGSNKGGDVMVNRSNNSTIDGQAGGDWINSAGSYNTIFGRSGGDSIEVAGGERNNVYAGADADTVADYGKNTTVYLEGGDDQAHMAGEQSWAFGGAGRDTISDSGKNNFIDGGADADNLVVTDMAENSTVRGGTGNDNILVSGAGHDVDGGADNDLVTVNNAFGSTLDGGAGDQDVLKLDFAYDQNVQFQRNGDVGANDYDITGPNGQGEITAKNFETIEFSDGSTAKWNAETRTFQVTLRDAPESEINLDPDGRIPESEEPPESEINLDPDGRIPETEEPSEPEINLDPDGRIPVGPMDEH